MKPLEILRRNLVRASQQLSLITGVQQKYTITRISKRRVKKGKVIDYTYIVAICKNGQPLCRISAGSTGMKDLKSMREKADQNLVDLFMHHGINDLLRIQKTISETQS